MRRSDREIKSFDEIVRVMEKCDVCRLALHDEEYPYILPLNFGMEVEDGVITLYFHGALEGKKYELMQKDARASFEMDCSHRLVTEIKDGNCSCTMEYESVIGQGRIEMIDDEEKYRALCVLMEHYHRENFRTGDENRPSGEDIFRIEAEGCPVFQFNKDVMQKTKVFKLVVEHVTGKLRMKR